MFKTTALALSLTLAAALAAQAATQVTKADFGVFARGLIGQPKLTATRVVDSSKDKAYGWAIWVKTDKPKVHFHETITLPSAVKGPWPSDAFTKVNPTRTGAVTDKDVAPKDGIVSNLWSVAADDPKGKYQIRVSVDGQPEKVFDFEVK
jgi:hypothetical protein